MQNQRRVYKRCIESIRIQYPDEQAVILLYIAIHWQRRNQFKTFSVNI